MRCNNTDDDQVRPLDKLFDEKIGAFESGIDRQCDKDLDEMVWTLGRFEEESGPQEAEEYEEAAPIEEELVEGELIATQGGRSPFRRSGRDGGAAGTALKQASGRSLGAEKRKKR